MDYYILDRELFFISKISKEIGDLIKVPIIDDKKHGNCYNNCLETGEEIINGYYIIMNVDKGVYEFIRHSIIKIGSNYFDITDPGLVVSSLYFIKTDKYFFDLPIKMYYDGEFETDYSLLKNGNNYVYGLFAPEESKPFYVGKGKGESTKSHLTENVLNAETNSHKSRTISKIGVDNVIIKKRYDSLLSEEFAYDLKQMVRLEYGI